MRPADREILEQLHALSATLGHRTMLLAQACDDVNVFAEGLRDIGHDLHDTGEAALARVAEIDAIDGVPTGQGTDRTAEISATLAILTDALNREAAPTVKPLSAYEPPASQATSCPVAPLEE